MIAYLEGILFLKEPTYVIIDVGGVGYEIRISLNSFIKLGDLKTKIRLYTHLHIREDAHTLIGFVENSEKKVFLQLINVSGVGINTALVILSSLNTAEVVQAIASEDVRTIQSIKGIGVKMAQRLILELKDKFKKDVFEGQSVITPTLDQHIKMEALTALTTLGIAKNIAEKNIETIIKQNKEPLTLEELIKLALRM